MWEILCIKLLVPHNIVMDLKVTSYPSQGPWPCSGEDHWLSSKGRPMGVGKAVLCSHGPSSIVWSENGPCCRTIAYFVGEKEGRIWLNIICLNLYQFEIATWWCLSILESDHGICHEMCPENLSCWENILKNNGLPKFAQGPPLGGRLDVNSGRPWNLIHSPSCRTPCRLFIHEFLFGPLGLHLRVQSELGRSPPFRPMRALRSQWSWAFSLVCEVALNNVM